MYRNPCGTTRDGVICEDAIFFSFCQSTLYEAVKPFKFADRLFI